MHNATKQCYNDYNTCSQPVRTVSCYTMKQIQASLYLLQQGLRIQSGVHRLHHFHGTHRGYGPLRMMLQVYTPSFLYTLCTLNMRYEKHCMKCSGEYTESVNSRLLLMNVAMLCWQ
jgi:hypothetical protein